MLNTRAKLIFAFSQLFLENAIEMGIAADTLDFTEIQ
jgi:hypothetical protein